MQFEKSKACNYSTHVFLPILFGVCAGIVLTVVLLFLLIAATFLHGSSCCFEQSFRGIQECSILLQKFPPQQRTCLCLLS